MALGITRTVGTSGIPVWQGTGKDIQLAQGGFKLAATGLPADTVIPAGQPMLYNEATRVATLVGTAVMQANAGAAATAYRVLKGHTLKVGDYLATGAAGAAAYAITAIDRTTSTVYDELTVGTTIGAALAGALMYASSATGATSSAYPAINGLLYDDTYGNTDESVSIVIRGTVYARRVPYNAQIAALAGLDDIIYSQSQ